MRITAKEARALAGPSVQDHVDAVYPKIRAAAEKKKRSVSLHDHFWVHEGYSRTENYKEAVALLENDGFNVAFFCEERQCVDMYTVVRW